MAGSTMSTSLPFQIIILRFKQLVRLFKGIDFIRLFFLLLIMAVISLMLYGWSSNKTFIPFWISLHSLLFIGIHISRKDKAFICMISGKPWLIFFTEYVLLSLPVLVFFSIHANWTGLLVIPLLLVISLSYIVTGGQRKGKAEVFFSRQQNILRFRTVKKVSTGNPLLFEWNSAFRQTHLFFGFIYLIIVSFSFKGYVAHIGIILLSAIISGCYFYGEPRLFIEVFANSAREFIFRKILLNYKYLGILYMPIVAISLISQTEMWYLLLIALFIGFIIQFLAIVFKYGLFRENSDLERNAMILYTSVIGVLLPFIWPLPVFMGIRYYRKAIKNLTPYFHGTN
jgi:hypothetical protein